MIFIVKKRLAMVLLSLLFLVLIVGAAGLPTATRYAFYGSTWRGSGGGKDYRSIDLTNYLVSVPDGNRAWRPNEYGYFASNTQKAFVSGFNGHEGAIRDLRDSTVQTYHFKPYVESPPIWSPDLKLFALSVATTGCDTCNMVYPRDIGIVDVATGNMRLVTRRIFFNGSLIWSPDQQWLVYVDGRYDNYNQHWVEAVKMIPADGSQSPRTLLTHVGTADSERLNPWLKWMPDGKHIAVIGHDGPETEIWYVDVATRQITYHYVWAQYLEICWSPTTDHFLTVSDSTYKMMTPAGAKPLDLSFVDPPLWRLLPGSTTPCAWSPDGNKLVLITHSNQYDVPSGVKVIDFVAHHVSDIHVTGRYSFLDPHWSADSRMLALRTYNPSRDPNDVFIYDMHTLQLVLFQKDLEFTDWVNLSP